MMPPKKKPKLLHGSDKYLPEKPAVKWLNTSEGWIPFVKSDLTSSTVYCGHIRMQVKDGCVNCLSCSGDNCNDVCACYCHLLQQYYWERDIK